MDSWVGASVERLIDLCGIPTQEYQVGDIIYLTYSSSQTRTHTNLPLRTGNAGFEKYYIYDTDSDL